MLSYHRLSWFAGIISTKKNPTDWRREGFIKKKSKYMKHSKDPTPVGKTGVLRETNQPNKYPQTGQEALIDWLQGTYEETEYEDIKKIIEDVFKDAFSESHPLRFYQVAERSTKGVVLGRSPRIGGKVTTRSDAYLEIGGDAMATLTQDQQQELFTRLEKKGFRCSRIDLTIDDFDKIFRPAEAYQAYIDGNISGFRNTGKFMQSGAVGKISGTFQIGKRGKAGSGKFYQIYDKFLESNGEIDSVRHELRLYSGYAKQAFSALTNTDKILWKDIIGGYIKGSINFIDRKVDEKACKCPPLTFWSRFTEQFTKLRFRSKIKPIQTLERKINWIKKQVMPSLATVWTGYQMIFGLERFKEWLYENLHDAYQRLSPQDLAIIEATKHEARYHNFLSNDFRFSSI